MKSCRIIVALLIAVIAIVGGCSGSDDDAGDANAQSQVDPLFATADAFVTHFNQLVQAGPMRSRDLAPLIYAETDFQREWLDFMNLVARAEILHDAAYDKFNATIDPRNDVRIELSFGPAVLVSEQEARAEVAVVSTSDSIKKLMLVKVGSRWWISAYTWEYSMSPAKRDELPRKRLSFLVDAEVGPPLASRIQAGEFSTIDQVRLAHRESLLTYFKAHPDVYEGITGKPFRPPD